MLESRSISILLSSFFCPLLVKIVICLLVAIFFFNFMIDNTQIYAKLCIIIFEY